MAAPTAANRVLVAATTGFLFVAPFAGSAGLRATALLLAGFALAWALRRPERTSLASFPRALLVAYFAWALFAFASWGWSVNRAYTFSEIRGDLFYGTLALIVFFLAANGPPRWRLWWTALIAGSLATFGGHVLQELLPFEISRHAIDGGGGAWTTHVVLIAPLLLALAWPRPWGERHGVLVQAGAFAVLALSAWMAANRIVWVALIVQLGIVMAAARYVKPLADARALRRLLLLTVAVMAFAFTFTIVERNAQLFGAPVPVTTHLQQDERPGIWRAAWREFKQAPLFGHGYGREILADRFEPLTPPIAGHPKIRHGHNVFANMALETGAAGLLLFLILVAVLVRQYVGFLRDPAVAPLGVMGLAMLAGFLTKNLTDDFLYRHNGVLFWALNGMLLGLGSAARRGR